ncbi:MAG: Stp1/IreP family PP2C-type Ser/Thr phosphatase [Acidobacteria bacterium]|nr:Stp1/IreP family PP2C-type Ser/Thr phosphatase [Acidobacteriota bacterium]
MAHVHVSHGALTHPGQVRTNNEDAFLVEDRLFVVADGMGGHSAGEVASGLAVASLRDGATGIVDEASMKSAMQMANGVIHTESMMNHLRHGMGTTIAALLVNDNDTVVVAHVGDARIYRWHEGNLSRVTKDHSYVQELVDEGVITLEEARVHPRRNIVTRALGIDAEVEVSTSTLPISIGSRYILCSDGLVDEVTDSEIAAILGRHESASAAAEALISAANSAGGRDNITVIVVDVLPESAGLSESSPSDETALSESSSSSLRVAERSSEDSPARALVSPNAPLPKAKVGLSLGFILFWTALAAIVLSVLIVFAAYGRTGYFVGFEGSDVVIYKGRPGGVLWFDPTVEARTPLKERDLTEDMAKEILGNPTFGDAVSAQRYVNGIRDEVQPVPTTTLPLPVTTTSSSTTTSSTSTTSTVAVSTTTTLGS